MNNKKQENKGCLIFFILIIISISGYYFYNRYTEAEEQKVLIEKQKIEKLNTEKNIQFKKSLGILENALLSPADINILKDAKESNIFNNKSFCDYYKEYKSYELKGNLKEADKVILDLKKVIGLDILLMAKGNDFCPVELSEIKESTNNEVRKGLNISSYLESRHSCSMSEDFIKMDLLNPKTADFSLFDCNTERNSDGSYTILRKVSAQNSFGVEKEFIYKVTIAYTGGNELDKTNWKLINIRSEEYR
ncbi:hypothetical protein [Empedobacter falsenii]|uniref:Uncharacterized protein n=1 Tax=Empedobacter falsenii TaxID=343874 RepID=A0A3R8TRW5_9FLAO|nr:hypothetical protein [Empedobacter falsenii]RRT94157.1 hypothetical protein EGI89_01980 [Empedobacter falsenii]RRT94351.1 hypothetical protein EGI88_01985 [Empedobacter falsenii]